MNHVSCWFTLVFALYLFLITLRKIAKSSTANDSGPLLPPGPRKLPFIGNMHQMVGLPHRMLRNLARKYGPLMYLQLGEIPTIVVSSAETAKEVLKDHDVVFANRRPIFASNIMSYGSTNIVVAPYGEYWRQLRKICSLELFSMKRIRHFQPLREEEIGNLIKSIASNAGLPVNLTEKVSLTNFNITSRLAFGRKFKDQERFASLVTKVIELASFLDIVDVFPSAKWIHFASGTKGKMERLHQEADQIMEDIINEHKESRAKISSTYTEGDQDLIDVLLEFEGCHNNGFSLSKDNIKAVILDVFGAGSETSATAVDWALVEMIRNLSVLHKAQAEVRRVVDKSRNFDEIALSELRYLKQVIKETLRLHPPIPLLPRECGKRCKINGFEIPFKSMVIINAWAIGRDPKYWTDPETFIPERFSNSSVDYKGNNFEYIPFGAGKRICPGTLLGLANTELFLAMMLYHFDWKLPSGMRLENLKMDESSGITARRKDDLYLIPTLYQPFSAKIPPSSSP